jgi:hypothetical protein
MSTNLKELEKTFLRFVEISTVSGGPKLDEETGLYVYEPFMFSAINVPSNTAVYWRFAPYEWTFTGPMTAYYGPVSNPASNPKSHLIYMTMPLCALSNFDTTNLITTSVDDNTKTLYLSAPISNNYTVAFKVFALTGSDLDSTKSILSAVSGGYTDSSSIDKWIWDIDTNPPPRSENYIYEDQISGFYVPQNRVAIILGTLYDNYVTATLVPTATYNFGEEPNMLIAPDKTMFINVTGYGPMFVDLSSSQTFTPSTSTDYWRVLEDHGNGYTVIENNLSSHPLPLIGSTNAARFYTNNDSTPIYITMGTDVSSTTANAFVYIYHQTFGDTSKKHTMHYADIIEFIPYKVNFKPISYNGTQIELSAFFDNGNNTMSVIGNDKLNLTWDIDDTSDNDFSPPIVGNDKITINYTGGSNLYSYEVSAFINDAIKDNRTTCVKPIYFNDNINLSSIQAENCLTALAVYQFMKIPVYTVSTLVYNWTFDTGLPFGEITPTNAVISACAINHSLTSIHNYTLDVNGSELSGSFRPYINLNNNSQLAHSLIDRSNGNETTTLFSIKVLGETGGKIHNLPINTFDNLIFSKPSGVTINPSNSKDPDDYFKVLIQNPKYDMDGGDPYQTISYDVTARIKNSAVSGIFTFESYPYIDYSVLMSVNGLNVDNTIVCMTSTTNIQLSAGVNGLQSATSGQYEFTLNSDVFSGNFSDLNTPILHNFSVPSNLEYATATVSVTANFEGVKLVKSVFKEIYLAPVVDNLTSQNDIRVYPEYKWDSNDGKWIQVIDIETNELKSNPPDYIWGNGRTETIILSAKENEMITYYNWYVKKNNNDWEFVGNERISKYNLKTSSDSDDKIDVRLNAEYEIDAVGCIIEYTPCSVLNALSSKYINPFPIPDISTNVPNVIPVPRGLNIELSNSTDLSSVPVKTILSKTILSLSSEYWNVSTLYESFGDNNLTFINVKMELTDIGDKQLSIPKFKVSPINSIIQPYIKYEYVLHPSHNDWVMPDEYKGFILIPQMNDTIMAYPIIPYYYVNNKYIALKDDIATCSIQNLVLPSNPNLIKEFKWSSNQTLSSLYGVNMYTNFVPTYIEADRYGIELSNKVIDAGVYTIKDNGAVYVLGEYPKFDSEANREIGNIVGQLPYSCGIGSNDWLTCENINLAFKKLYDNLIYLYKQSKVYINPPTEYIGWLGSYMLANKSLMFRWLVNQIGLNYKYTDPRAAISDPNKFSNLQDCVVDENMMYISDSTSVQIISSDFQGTELYKLTNKMPGTPFNCINTVQIDSDGWLYLLDSIDPFSNNMSSRNEIMVFIPKNNEWKLTYFWGGLGSAISNTRFRNPRDMFVDKDKYVWIVDTDNLVIKKYYRNGDWKQTISSNKFTTNSKPISLCIDSNNNLQVLYGNNNIIVFDNNGTYQYEYTVNMINEQPYTRIRPCIDGGFIYVISSNDIIKCDLYGQTQLPFRKTSLSPLYVEEGHINNRSIFHDQYRNLYVCQKNHILKYNDQISHISLVEDSVMDKMWKLEDIYIKKQEYVQDWVINRALNRMWDNIELFRRSILGKLSYERIIREEPLDESWETLLPKDRKECLIDWLPVFNHTRDSVKMYCHIVPVIRTFLPFEYLPPAHKKEDVIIGINEFVTADVINRVLCQLQDNLLVILEMLQAPKDKRDELCEGIDIQPITILDPRSISLSECYPELLEESPCGYAVSLQGPSNPCTGIPIEYKAEIISTDQCLNNIQSYTWYVNDEPKSTITNISSHVSFEYTFEDTTNTIIGLELSANNMLYNRKEIIVSPQSC